MNSFQESKNELEAAIRYAENAISSAQGTIESMEFRQEMAKKQYAEQTGREESLTKLVKELEEANEKLVVDNYNLECEVEKLRKEKEASSAPCGCQAYRDLEERATMPVIPKDVALAIYKEGVLSGVYAACEELEGQRINIEENEYVGDFEVSFSREIDIEEHLDLDWMRGKVGDYSDDKAIEALKGLCSAKEFECRIHGIDDNE